MGHTGLQDALRPHRPYGCSQATQVSRMLIGHTAWMYVTRGLPHIYLFLFPQNLEPIYFLYFWIVTRILRSSCLLVMCSGSQLAHSIYPATLYLQHRVQTVAYFDFSGPITKNVSNALRHGFSLASDSCNKKDALWCSISLAHVGLPLFYCCLFSYSDSKSDKQQAPRL